MYIFSLSWPVPQPFPSCAPRHEEGVYLTILYTVGLVNNNSVWMECSIEKGKLDNDELFIHDTVCTDGLNLVNNADY